MGTWRNVIAVITDDGDVQSTETTWTFTATSCRRTVTLISTTFGVVDENVRDCTYTTDAVSVSVLFDGDSLEVTFAAAFRGDTLFLDDFAFVRVSS